MLKLMPILSFVLLMIGDMKVSAYCRYAHSRKLNTNFNRCLGSNRFNGRQNASLRHGHSQEFCHALSLSKQWPSISTDCVFSMPISYSLRNYHGYNGCGKFRILARNRRNDGFMLLHSHCNQELENNDDKESTGDNSIVKDSNFVSTQSYCRKRSSQQIREIDHGNDQVVMNIKDAIESKILPTAASAFTKAKQSLQVEVDVSKVSIVAILAISGGCDSMALFHGFMALLENQNGHLILNGIQLLGHNISEMKCEVHIVHFDHQQRSEESDQDRQLVEMQCKEYGVPFHCYYWSDHISKISCDDIDQAMNFSQASARSWRQSNLITLLSEKCSTSDNVVKNIGFILTAHHADDNDETMLLKFLRGTHITSLSGIEPFSVFASKNGTPAIFGRPLLKARKVELQNFLNEHFQEPWREDKSNKSNKYLRNRVRNELIPLLSDISGGEVALHKRLSNLQKQSRDVKDYLSQND